MCTTNVTAEIKAVIFSMVPKHAIACTLTHYIDVMATVSTSDWKDRVGRFVLALLFAVVVCNNVTAEIKAVIFSMAEFGEGGGGGIFTFFSV